MAQPKQDTAVRPLLNEEFPWDTFDSEWYLRHNYGVMRDDDQDILMRLAEFFSGLREPKLLRGIDVGTGTNLYPVFALLPLCSQITMYERAKTNCGWLARETARHTDIGIWQPYWDVLSKWPLYAPIRDPQWAVHERTRVNRGSIFDLPKSAYDIGTMFFCAESITERGDEFARATRCFLRSLRPNAPFAAAFMRNSHGYEVNGVHFPAVAITADDVQKCLHSEGIRKASVINIDSANPLRDGVGMVLVTGRIARR
ncbi:MAG: methyltransferase [Actinobacteria bacterium]|nr:MAG: methyltransferase [Actinomycetota bacterium]